MLEFAHPKKDSCAPAQVVSIKLCFFSKEEKGGRCGGGRGFRPLKNLRNALLFLTYRPLGLWGAHVGFIWVSCGSHVGSYPPIARRFPPFRRNPRGALTIFLKLLYLPTFLTLIYLSTFLKLLYHACERK